MSLPNSSFISSDRPQNLSVYRSHIPSHHYHNNLYLSPGDIIETDSKSPLKLPQLQLPDQFTARSPFLAGEEEEKDMKKTPTTPVSLQGQPENHGTADIVSRGPHPSMGSYQSVASGRRSQHQPPSEMPTGQSTVPSTGIVPGMRTEMRRSCNPTLRQSAPRQTSTSNVSSYSSASASSGTYSSVSVGSLSEQAVSFPYQQLPQHGVGDSFRHYPVTAEHMLYPSYNSSSMPQYGGGSVPILHEQSPSSQPNSLTLDYQSATYNVESISGQMDELHIREKQKTTPIKIVVEPHDCEVLPNERASFVCKARITISQEFEEEPTYLWYKDEQPLVGEVNSEYIVEKVTEEDTGTYSCLVMDSSSKYQQMSQNAKLTLSVSGARVQRKAPKILEQPKPYVEATAGGTLKLVITANGEGRLRYKWYKDTRELVYATSNTLEIPNINQLDNGQYCCAIANDHGSILSEICQVSVLQRPTDRGSSSQTKTKLYQSASPTVAQYIHQPRPTSYQKWDNLPVTDLFLREVSQQVAKQTVNWSRLALFLGLSTNDVVQCRMHFHHPDEQAFQLLRIWREHKKGGDKSTLQTILTQAGINLPHVSAVEGQVIKPRIFLHPQSTKVVYGQPARLFVQVDNASLHTTYQWYRNNKILGGKVSPELIISSCVDSDKGDYFCIITNQAGSTTSKVARIDVVDINPLSAQYQTRQQYLYDPTYLGYQSRDATTTEKELETEDQHSLSTGATRETTHHDDIGKIPRIVQHPESQMVHPGSALTLICAAEGGGQLDYLWYFNGLSLKDETRPQYSINCFTDEDEGMYACQVMNAYGKVVSKMAHIVMKLN